MDDLRFRYPVYRPADCAIDTVKDWGQDCLTASDDAALVLSQPYSIAAMPVFYDRSDNWAYSAQARSLDLNKFDLILFSDPEYSSLSEIRAWLPVNDYLLAYGGLRADESPDASREVYRPYYIRDFFEQNTPQTNRADVKPYLFDVLLGARRPHRDFVWQALRRSGLLDKTITTYRSGFPGSVQDHVTDQVQSFFNEALQHPYVSANLDPAWEVAEQVANYHSRISPVEIYRRTWYSIVCETQHTGDHFFLSEKTIKAMYNRRIFVLFGPRGYLANLQHQGFQTFDAFVDESYDQEPRDIFRWQRAMHAVWQLAWFEQPQQVYEDYAWILDQNQNMLLDLEQKRCRDLRELMLRTIPAEHWYLD